MTRQEAHQDLTNLRYLSLQTNAVACVSSDGNCPQHAIRGQLDLVHEMFAETLRQRVRSKEDNIESMISSQLLPAYVVDLLSLCIESA